MELVKELEETVFESTYDSVSEMRKQLFEAKRKVAEILSEFEISLGFMNDLNSQFSESINTEDKKEAELDLLPHLRFCLSSRIRDLSIVSDNLSELSSELQATINKMTDEIIRTQKES